MGIRGIFGRPRTGRNEWTKANIVNETVYVDASSTPDPQAGRRVWMEASTGPAMLAGPTGPDTLQEPRLRSVTRISMSATPVFGSVWIMVLRSLMGEKKFA